MVSKNITVSFSQDIQQEPELTIEPRSFDVIENSPLTINLVLSVNLKDLKDQTLKIPIIYLSGNTKSNC